MNKLKKERVFLFIIVMFAFVFFLASVQAQIQNDTEISEDSINGELEIKAGTTPDSLFYFFDNFFDTFGDELKVREEKVAEIREMVQEGKIEEAKIALNRYNIYADFLEEEVDPENKEEALRSAAAIRKVIMDLEDELPESDREEFSEIIEREERIKSAVEIAGKIKELCQTLSDLDPLEYSRVCKTDDDTPRWQKELDDDLTEEQREEARKFGEIMQECFETSGQQCRCSEIPFTDFAQTCSTAAPLAVQCEIEGNEEACEQLDDIEMPELPHYLQDVFDNLERDIAESQFEVHMPRECREEGATSSRECMRIMVRTHAPQECRDELIEADVQSEREAREICEEIMFQQNAPQECIDAGIDNPHECSILVFQQNAPQECIDAGLTGEHRSDHRKCEQIIKGVEGEGVHRASPALGYRCREIQNPEERLSCYDNALQGTQEFNDRFQQTLEEERQCVETCSAEGKGWSFSNGVCECFGGPEDFEGDFESDFEEQERQFCEEEGGTFVCEGDSCYCEFTSSTTDTGNETTSENDTESDSTSTNSTSEENSTTETDNETITGSVVREVENGKLTTSQGNTFCSYAFSEDFCETHFQ